MQLYLTPSFIIIIGFSLLNIKLCHCCNISIIIYSHCCLHYLVLAGLQPAVRTRLDSSSSVSGSQMMGLKVCRTMPRPKFLKLFLLYNIHAHETFTVKQYFNNDKLVNIRAYVAFWWEKHRHQKHNYCLSPSLWQQMKGLFLISKTVITGFNL